jgi:hypothetical protein
VVVAAVDSAAVVVVVSLLVVVATVVATVAAVVDSHPTRCLGEGLSEVIGTLMLKVPGLASEIWTFDPSSSHFLSAFGVMGFGMYNNFRAIKREIAKRKKKGSDLATA